MKNHDRLLSIAFLLMITGYYLAKYDLVIPSLVIIVIGMLAMIGAGISGWR